MISPSQIKEEPLIVEETQLNTDSSIIQRFFKVMVPGFHKKLTLPPIICEKLKDKRADHAVLTSRRGNWVVKIRRCVNGKMYFKDGWADFGESHGLEIGDFVVFEHQCNMHFKVVVYDSSCCEKDFSLDVKKDRDDDDDDDYDDHDDDGDVRRKIYEQASTRIRRGRPPKISKGSQESRQFMTRISAYNLSNGGFYLPKRFWTLNKLEGRTLMLLTGPSGRSCKVKLKWGPRDPVFTSGWVDFCQSNNIQVGDICLFKLTHDPPTSSGPVRLAVQVISAPS